MTAVKYRRVLLKLSGEAFKGKTAYGINAPTVAGVARQIKQMVDMGVEVAVVVGAGNIWRGATAEKEGIDRVTADYAGMLATVINALPSRTLLRNWAWLPERSRLSLSSR